MYTVQCTCIRLYMYIGRPEKSSVNLTSENVNNSNVMHFILAQIKMHIAKNSEYLVNIRLVVFFQQGNF